MQHTAMAETQLDTTGFPLDLGRYAPVPLYPGRAVDDAALRQLETNIELVRHTIVFYTAVAGAKGLGGHTGGAYDIVPEVLIADGFMRGGGNVYPAYFDEAGHRVAIQYAMAAFNGVIPFERLLHYREFGHGLYGHPEREPETGIAFSSGRLGHMWAFVNGVAMANPQRAVVLFGSDGSQQEGTDAEAARLAVAQRLNVKLVIDDNDVTISGHPSEYLPGFDVAKTLEGHGLHVLPGPGEDLSGQLERFQEALAVDGPVAIVNRRTMAPSVPGIEGSTKGHDVISVEFALEYLSEHGLDDAVAFLKDVKPSKTSVTFKGSSPDKTKNRAEFGVVVCDILDEMTPEERKARVVAIDSDLAGSCGLDVIKKRHPEIFVPGGVAERGNFSAAAGFGYEAGKQGIFATFSAFLEMVVSEITMARLNQANVLAHFSHAGVDDMADNTSHFGVNNFFGDTGLLDDETTRLYFPADRGQFRACVKRIFNEPGLRFVFSTRSGTPAILDEAGKPVYGEDHEFVPDRDDVIREGSAGYVVSYGEMLYRALDAVERARESGVDVGLVNKTTLNTFDEEALTKIGKAPFVLVVESQNQKSGLGVRLGAALLSRGYAPKFRHMGTVKVGVGGLSEQIPYQGLAPDDILARIDELSG